jgi:uncharacterized membrane protein
MLMLIVGIVTACFTFRLEIINENLQVKLLIFQLLSVKMSDILEVYRAYWFMPFTRASYLKNGFAASFSVPMIADSAYLKNIIKRYQKAEKR